MPTLTGFSRVFVAVTFIGVAGGSVLAGQSVELKGGDVFYRSSAGIVKRLTTEGLVEEASLSADGKSVVIVSTTHLEAPFREPTNPAPILKQLRVLSVGGGPAQLVIDGGLTLSNGARFASFSGARLSTDARSVYVLIPLTVTVGGLVRVDRNTRSARLVTPALSFFQVEQGRYRGNLVVEMRRANGGAMVNDFWLFGPNGEKLGFVGGTYEEAKKFLNNSNPRLRPPPPPVAPI